MDHGSYYPNLVRVFHYNLSLKFNNLTSSIKVISISLTIQQLEECLETHFVGNTIWANFDPIWDNYDKKTFCYSISCLYELEILQEQMC